MDGKPIAPPADDESNGSEQVTFSGVSLSIAFVVTLRLYVRAWSHGW